ncbi:MAG: hypothetical protein KKF44_03645 [Nanoarchaeota archaeon]|nr:hypothetical protein [Nanoarchaeota archaeon]
MFNWNVELNETIDQYSIMVNGTKRAHVHKLRENLEIHLDMKNSHNFQIIKLFGTGEIVIVFGKKEKLGGEIICQH